jgi:predicted transposase/invertase (TIGR01784 family)
MVEVIPLKYGATFKRIFSQTDVFCQFVQDVLGITINIDKVYTEYEYPETIGFVKTKYDLFAEDKEQRIIVEIQNVKEEDFFERFLYYHIISIAEQVKGYEAYRFDRTVYTIVVLTSVPRDKSVNFSFAVSDMNPIDELGQKVEIYPHRLIFLTPRLVYDKTPKGVRAWLELIADSLDSRIDERSYDSPLFKRIISEIERTAISPEEASEIKDEAAWELAKERFIREGREEGHKEGREEGHREAAEAIALAMLERGAEITFISEVTGLKPDEIDKLKIKR